MTETQPQAEHVMQLFAYDHLPQELHEIGSDFRVLAFRIFETLPPSHERTLALRKLLEAKGAALLARVAG